MKKDKIKKIFNLSAPFFDLLDNFSVAKYNRNRAFLYIKDRFDLYNKKVLDLGCGTGIWSNLFKKEGAKVEGIDFSPAMIKIARSKYIGIKFKIADAANLNTYSNNFFDIVTASFVLHDIQEKERINILKEIKRISENCIIFDYGDNIPFVPSIFEFFEGNNYKNFLKNFYSEIKEVFKYCEKINLKKSGVLYLCN